MTLKEYKEKKMKDPEFAAAYEEMKPEMNVLQKEKGESNGRKRLDNQMIESLHNK